MKTFSAFLFIVFSIFFFVLNSPYRCGVFAQSTATVSGIIRDDNKIPVEAANVAVEGTAHGTVTDRFGNFTLTVPSGSYITVAVTYVGYETIKIPLHLKENAIFRIDTAITRSSKQLPDVLVEDREIRTSTLTRIDPKIVSVIPTAGGNIESILKTLPGVASSNEMSSQYSVRGGNYDENLVYVNDVEIYRPFLIRNGQQEGLSFVNSAMVSSILFSAGGFEAKYGDKMSSVLDIRYKKPGEFAGSAEGGLLGGALHIESASKNHRFTQITGIRYRSNEYLLKSMNTKGEFKPAFTDVQTYLTYDISDKTEISFLGNYSGNKFRFVPETRQTRFGTINQAYQLTIYFDGQEIDDFKTALGAFTLTRKPHQYLELKWIASAFKTIESEKYDILGQYWIQEVEKDMSDEKFGQATYTKGVGTHLNHARNNLDGLVYNMEHKGTFLSRSSQLQWGLKVQREEISDKLSEWTMIDSAGYSLPHPADSPGYSNPLLQPQQEIRMKEVLKTAIGLQSVRWSGYIQKKWSFMENSKFTLIAGIRSSYWDVNGQTTLSPRAAVSFRPLWKRDFVFRFSGGVYHQPPFYRELRDLDGVLHTSANPSKSINGLILSPGTAGNTTVFAQQSIHLVAGSDYNFLAWNRPFKIVTEVYYKYLTDLIPYKIDNVRIRYYAKNNSHGYATGIDLRVNGEFVKGLESWASLSVMQTREDIEDDFYYEYFNSDGEKIYKGYTWNDIAVDSIRHEPSYIPRPTDQRVTFGLFFQDYLPMLPDFKMHLSLLFGSGFPFGPPGTDKYKDTLKIPPYRRVDIGFSYLIMDKSKRIGQKKFFKPFRSIWLSAEVFNLLGTNNTISYLWVMDVTGRIYAVPNYLTQRLLNMRMIVEF